VIQFFSEPLGFINIHREENEKEDSDVEADNNNDEEDDNDEEIDDDGLLALNRLPPLQVDIPENSSERRSSTPSNVLEKSKKTKKSTGLKLPFVKCLLFAPVHINLATLFDRKIFKFDQHSHPIPSYLLFQWIQELILAIDYLSSW
jgi:hypothetical protein